MQRKRARAPIDPNLSADQQKAFERFLELKGVAAEQFLAFLLRGENRALVELLLAKVAAEPTAQEQERETKRKQQISQAELPAREPIFIPLALLSQQQIGSLEAICQYLRDTRALTYTQIGTLLNRDPRTVWTSCSKAKQQEGQEASKQRGKQVPTRAEFSVPLAIFADRRLSILEATVVHLREDLGYKPFQIAELLQRDQRVVATIWHRVKRKRAATNTNRTEVGR